MLVASIKRSDIVKNIRTDIRTGGASDDRKLTGLDVLVRVTKYLIGSPIIWQEALQALSQGGSTVPPWCRHRVVTVLSFLNTQLCRWLKTETSYKFSEKSFSLTNSCYHRHNYYD
jgi:hypothetical protein